MNRCYQISIVFILGAFVGAGCSTNSGANSGATASPSSVNAAERMKRVQEILADRPTGPEDIAKVRAELTVVAGSDAPEKNRAIESLKLLESLEKEMPTGAALDQTRQMCQELSTTSIDALKQALGKTLARSASLESLQVEKCAPNGTKGDSVNLRAGFKMKTSTGESISDRENFVAITGEPGGPKYKATVKSK